VPMGLRGNTRGPLTRPTIAARSHGTERSATPVAIRHHYAESDAHVLLRRPLRDCSERFGRMMTSRPAHCMAIVSAAFAAPRRPRVCVPLPVKDIMHVKTSYQADAYGHPHLRLYRRACRHRDTSRAVLLNATQNPAGNAARHGA